MEGWDHVAGFLEKRSKRMKLWNVRWCVLADGELRTYIDESEAYQTGSYIITQSTIVEALPFEGEKKFIFAIHDPSQDYQKLILNAYDAGDIERWMIGFIQASNGAFRDSENFDTGDGNGADDDIRISLRSSLGNLIDDHRDSDSNANKSEVANSDCDPDHSNGTRDVGGDSLSSSTPTAGHTEIDCSMQGLLWKRNRRNALWKKRYVAFDNGTLRYYVPTRNDYLRIEDKETSVLNAAETSQQISHVDESEAPDEVSMRGTRTRGSRGSRSQPTPVSPTSHPTRRPTRRPTANADRIDMSSDRLRGIIVIDEHTKFIPLPRVFEGRSYGFSLVTNIVACDMHDDTHVDDRGKCSCIHIYIYM